MNQSALKTYAPIARREFIKAITSRAAHFGVAEGRIEPAKVDGDTAIIGGRPFPSKIIDIRKKLEIRIEKNGFSQVMEAVAYTWFNRLVAIRFMELHNYLDHGYRVLSHPAGENLPEILSKADQVKLVGLNTEEIVDLRLAGNKDGEIYRMLLIAQCNELHKAMPFLFENVDDETELLLPDNLLHSDSLIRQMVEAIPDEDWGEVEILGWLYQYYISEKKDQVIGKVVKSEDIPAATQLFTPNWIVQYMVQNSLGAQWMATHPTSGLKAKMPFYIEPVEQEEEVQKHINEITPKSLNPEELTLIDPACGSGHILLEAYNLFKEIYIERGYRPRDIPRLILEKNLFGLDIDDRAAQLAGLSVLMKARSDDRSILQEPPKLNILSIQETNNLDADEISRYILSPKSEVTKDDVRLLVSCFVSAKTFGSLITIPEDLRAKLPKLKEMFAEQPEDMFTRYARLAIGPLIRQADLFLQKYDVVVANPPYMGNNGMCAEIKTFLSLNYKAAKSDLFSAFIIKCLDMSQQGGRLGFVTPFVWMFLESFQKLRHHIAKNASITNLIQLEYNAFAPACIPVCTFTFLKSSCLEFKGGYIKLSDFNGSENQAPRAIEAIENRGCGWFYSASFSNFERIPGSPIAYWISEGVINSFKNGRLLSLLSKTREGMSTGKNEKYVRCWHEVDIDNIGFDLNRPAAKNSGKAWFPYVNGGPTRKWYGNHDDIVYWYNDGEKLQSELDPSGTRVRAHNFNLDCIFNALISWSKINAHYFSARLSENGFLFSSGAPSLFPNEPELIAPILCFLNSKFSLLYLNLLNPTLNCNPGTIGSMPFLKPEFELGSIANDCVAIAKYDWDVFERSWNFTTHPFITHKVPGAKMKDISRAVLNHWSELVVQMKKNEEKNNEVFAKALGLEKEYSAEASAVDITLNINQSHSYFGQPNPQKLLLKEVIVNLLSWSVGCMMGRYSLDQQGLIYASAGGKNFDLTRYKIFAPDDDGIIPITDQDWFADDVANRFNEFLSAAWGNENLGENVAFVASALSESGEIAAPDIIRKYFANTFFKDHFKLYKKRPIYWLFSSGKLKAFQALVYLHRYNESTLARMRTEYVIPLQGKMNSRIDQLKDDIEKADSSSLQKKLKKEYELLQKQKLELSEFDEKLRHLADLRVKLDLDDGVKVNYGKFGDLLADVKSVVGKNEDE